MVGLHLHQHQVINHQAIKPNRVRFFFPFCFFLLFCVINLKFQNIFVDSRAYTCISFLARVEQQKV